MFPVFNRFSPRCSYCGEPITGEYRLSDAKGEIVIHPKCLSNYLATQGGTALLRSGERVLTVDWEGNYIILLAFHPELGYSDWAPINQDGSIDPDKTYSRIELGHKEIREHYRKAPIPDDRDLPSFSGDPRIAMGEDYDG